MRFSVVAASTADFEAWVASVRKTGGTLDTNAFTELAKPRRAAGVPTFGTVAQGLFDSIAAGHNEMPMVHPKER
jgi:hypothetical protein